MSPIIGIVIFLILFAILMVAVGLGSRFLELRGKKQVATMLGNESEQEEVVETSILVDPQQRDTLESLVDRAEITGQVQAMIQQSGLTWTPLHLYFAMAAGTIAGALIGWFLDPLGFTLPAAIFCAILLGGAPFFYMRHKRKKRMDEFEEQLPEALDFLARSMRAGHAFSISLEMLGSESPDPLGQEFRALFAEQNLGAPVEVALTNFGKRVPLLDVRLFVSAVMLQRQTGGNLSEVLLRLSYLIRERFRLKGQVKAASAHGRMTSGVLTALPLVMIVALQFVAPGYLAALVKDSDGRWMIAFAVLAQIAGYFVMRSITNIKV
jgi:tight adherence protein B